MISGLVDTGADRSVLPVDYAEELGYTVDGIPEVEFEIAPLFVASLNALWGRADLMTNFTVSISEKAKELTLQPSERATQTQPLRTSLDAVSRRARPAPQTG